MPYVICAPCVGALHENCIDVCPSGAIHPDPNDANFGETDQLYIDPDACSNCGNCAEVCPVTAIYPLGSVPPQWASYISKNAQYFR